MASKLARKMVSKQKRRFKADGFDLDLSYITESIIAMGIPSIGVEGAFRNPMSEVIRFFENFHPGNAKIFNLCIEPDRQYAVENFSGQVASFPFYDHNCPPLTYIPRFCDSAYRWMKDGLDHVVAVHCKAGKSRTGLMVCCLLLHIHEQTDPDTCIHFYGGRRTHDGKGVTIPSQRRFINYYKTMLEANVALADPKIVPETPANRLVRLTAVELFDVPTKLVERGDALQFALMDHGTLDGEPNLYTSWDPSGQKYSAGKLIKSEGDGDVEAEPEGTCRTNEEPALDGESMAEALARSAMARSEVAKDAADIRWEMDVLLGRKAVRDNGTEDVKLLFFEKEDKKDKRHKLFYTFLHTAFLAEPDESGKVTFTLYREQCDKFGQKKKFPKTFRVVLTFTDCEPRDAELSPDDAIFREKKAAYDQYEAEETRIAAAAAKSKKSKKDEATAAAGDEILTPEQEKQRMAVRQALEGQQGFLDQAKAACVNFIETEVLNTSMLPIDATKDWGTYRIGNLQMSGVAMAAEHLWAKTTDGALRVSVAKISAEVRDFIWNYERTKMPKAQDTCTANAALQFAVDFEFALQLDPAGQLAVEKPNVQLTVSELDLEILTCKHTWMQKRLMGFFTSTIRQSVETALQEKTFTTRATEELHARIMHAAPTLILGI